jgi:hypothetical protein
MVFEEPADRDAALGSGLRQLALEISVEIAIERCAGAQELEHRRVGGMDAPLLIHAVHTEALQMAFGIEEAKTVAIVYNRWGL